MQQSDRQTEIEELLMRAQIELQQADYSQALDRYEQVIELIAEPKQESEFTTIALSNIGEIHYKNEQFDLALDDFSNAVQCKGGLGNAQIHLRLGQLRYRRGEMDRAADELMRAYMAAGDLVFANEDSKYFSLIKPYISPGRID